MRVCFEFLGSEGEPEGLKHDQNFQNMINFQKNMIKKHDQKIKNMINFYFKNMIKLEMINIFKNVIIKIFPTMIIKFET